MSRLINLTPHAVTIRLNEADIIIKPTEPAARVGLKTYRSSYRIASVWTENNIEIPVHVPLFGDVEYLPDPQEGVIYITSMIVASSLTGKERGDVMGLDTGPSAIRDGDGNIVAVRGLVKY